MFDKRYLWTWIVCARFQTSCLVLFRTCLGTSRCCELIDWIFLGVEPSTNNSEMLHTVSILNKCWCRRWGWWSWERVLQKWISVLPPSMTFQECVEWGMWDRMWQWRLWQWRLCQWRLWQWRLCQWRKHCRVRQLLPFPTKKPGIRHLSQL